MDNTGAPTPISSPGGTVAGVGTPASGGGGNGFLSGLADTLAGYLSGNQYSSKFDQANKQADTDRDTRQQMQLYEFQKQIDKKYSTDNSNPNLVQSINTDNVGKLSGLEWVPQVFGKNKDVSNADFFKMWDTKNKNSGEKNEKPIPASYASQYLQGLGLDKDDADIQAQAAQKAFGDNIPSYALDGIGKQGGKDLTPQAIAKQFEMANTDPKTGKPKYVKHVPGSLYGTNEVPLNQDEIQTGQELLKDSLKNPGSTHIQSIDELNDLSSKAMVAYNTLTTSPKQGGKGMDSFTAGSKVIENLKKQGYSKLAISKVMRNIQITNLHAIANPQGGQQQPTQQDQTPADFAMAGMGNQ